MNEEKLSPVCVFGYNRPEHLKKCLDSLAKCELAEQTDIFIFCDGSKTEKAKKKCELVVAVARKEEALIRFHSVSVVVSEKNKGLAKSIISGVTSVINQYGTAIVLEDDLVVSPHYLKFMNQALQELKDDKSIWSVTGYTYPLKSLQNYKKDAYLSYRISSYGWGTWKDRWEIIDWDVKDYDTISHSPREIQRFNRGGGDMFRTLKKCVVKGLDVWAIKFSYAQYKNNMYTVYPSKTLITSNGYDGSGTNSQSTGEYKKLKIDDAFSVFNFNDLEVNNRITKEFRTLYRFSPYEWLKYRYTRWRKKYAGSK